MALTHLDAAGRARMVDVGGKPETERMATAKAIVAMRDETRAMVAEGRAAKGDVMAAARLAGIMAAKRTAELIPLCHTLPLTGVLVDIGPTEMGLEITATARNFGRTGVEMEALTAATVAALTVYDMCKAVDREMRIEARLVAKSGGASGDFSQP